MEITCKKSYQDGELTDEQLQMEKEANEIAFELLMPKIDVDYFFAKGKSVDEMAKFFYVETPVMSSRLKQLGHTTLENLI